MSDPVADLAAKLIAKAAEQMPEPRWSRQEKLEEEISKFNPDFLEAEEMLDAIFGRNFKLGRCSDGQWDVVELALADFKRRLQRAADMQPMEPEYEPPMGDQE